jgi:DNA-binding response OmpR family regulator
VNVTDRTIDTHIFGLRKKLGDCSETIETIRGVGYRIKIE